MRRRELLKIPKWCNNPIGLNLIDLDDIIDQSFYTYSHMEVFIKQANGRDLCTSGYIRVNPGETYKYTRTTDRPGAYWAIAGLYDKKKTFIDTWDSNTFNGNVSTRDVPEGVYYVRMNLGYTDSIHDGVLCLERSN